MADHYDHHWIFDSGRWGSSIIEIVKANPRIRREYIRVALVEYRNPPPMFGLRIEDRSRSQTGETSRG